MSSTPTKRVVHDLIYTAPVVAHLGRGPYPKKPPSWLYTALRRLSRALYSPRGTT